jgi:hypothetical protein
VDARRPGGPLVAGLEQTQRLVIAVHGADVYLCLAGPDEFPHEELIARRKMTNFMRRSCERSPASTRSLRVSHKRHTEACRCWHWPCCLDEPHGGRRRRGVPVHRPLGGYRLVPVPWR